MCFLPITRGIKTGNSTARDSVGIQGDVCISISYNIPFFFPYFCVKEELGKKRSLVFSLTKLSWNKQNQY